MTARGEHFLGTVIDQAHSGGMWQPLVDVFHCMTPEAREVGVPVLRGRMVRSPELDAKVRVLAIQLGVEALL